VQTDRELLAPRSWAGIVGDDVGRDGTAQFHPDWAPRLVVGEQPDAMLVEQLRGLAAALHQAQAGSGLRVLLVTSAEPGEGKSLTCMNLALTLSESYRRRVLLIDADLRRPSLHEIAQVSNRVGLRDILSGPTDQKLPVYKLSKTLTLVPAGKPDMNPMVALSSPRMGKVLAEAAAVFDWVIVDAPPLLPVADATLLAPMCDASLLVVKAGQTHYAAAQKAADMLDRERILGVVLNGAVVGRGGGYRYEYQAQDAE
jgi:capsular exopolysaccharide synthesis family protein